MCRQLKNGNPTARLFDFTYSQLLREFRKASRALGVTAVPYQARHSGASLDAALGYRSKAAIKARGRWAKDKSVARYESKAKVVDSPEGINPKTLAYMQKFISRLGELLRGRIEPHNIAPP